MSKGDRDGRHRPHSGKRCPEAAAGGCEWDHTGYAKRPARRILRHAGRRESRDRALEPSTGPGVPFPTWTHVFDGERCIHCGANVYDVDCDDDAYARCVPHEPFVFTTWTPDVPGRKNSQP